MSVHMEEIRATRTQAERRAASERRILDAAIELLASQGYGRTTLDEIGERSGYTGALVSKRFGSKVGLLRAVLADTFDRIVDESQSLVDRRGPDESELQGYMRLFLARIETSPAHIRALYAVMGESLGPLTDVRDEIADFNRQTRERVSARVRAAVESGEVRADVDADRIALLILAFMRGLAFLHMSDPTGNVLSDASSDIALVYDGIAARRPRGAA